MFTTKNLGILRATSFEKSWGGFWSLLFCSYYERIYTQLLANYVGVGIQHGIFLTRKGFTTAYLSSQSRKKFGKTVGKKFSSAALTKRWCDDWMATGEKLQAYLHHARPGATLAAYQQYRNVLDSYAYRHIGTKNVIDFLPPAILQKTRTILEHARLATEAVYVDSEKYLRRFAAAVGRKAKLPQSLVLCFTEPEMFAWLKGKPSPVRQLLEQRNRGYALWFRGRRVFQLVGKDVDELERTILMQRYSTVLHGATAYPGKAQGVVRIVFDPSKQTSFKSGDILVTTMTRPEYVPLMKLAAAVVTDGGGMLSHAAIVARELKKPTVIGTQVATQVLKTGDRVEIDAENGLVRKI